MGILSGEAIYRDVVAYTDLGEHRTATDVDRQTADWIARELAKVGIDTAFQPFALHQFFVEDARLTVGEKDLACFPLWPVRSTGPRPVRAPLASFATDADKDHLRDRIALIPFGTRPDPSRPSRDDTIQKAIAAGALGVIALAHTPSGQLVGSLSLDRSARWTKMRPQPFPVPVAIVGSADAPTLQAAADHGAEVRLLVDGRDERAATARNVIGTLARGKRLVVVSTPFSGWFRCGGERGPGVALTLALARWAAGRKTDTTYLFDFNSGHELMGLGAHAFLEELAPKPAAVHCWVHLGANIATWKWEKAASGWERRAKLDSQHLVTGDAGLLPVLQASFGHVPGLQPYQGPGIGELVAFIAEGYRAWGLFGGGGNLYMHAPGDGPESTAPALLEPVAEGLSKALAALETTD